MNYYNRYPGDYARKTQDLSLVEHGAYTLLLDHLYGTQQVLPKNPVGLFRVTRAFSQEEQEAVLCVIKRFFVETEEGYTNARFEEERAKAKTRIDAARENGKKGGRGQKKTQNESKENPVGLNPLTQNEPSGSAYHQPSAISHQLNTKDQDQDQEKKKKEGAKPSAIACPPDVNESVWQDWLSLRKAKKAPVSETVLKEARRESEKANMSFEDFLKEWCVRGSQGLKAEWIKPSERPRATAHSGFADKNYNEGIGDDGRIL